MPDAERSQFAVDATGRIVVDPQTRSGKPIVRGTRVCVSELLGQLAGGLSPAEYVRHFPTVTLEDVEACLRYAAGLADAQGVTPAWRVGRPDFADVVARLAEDERLDAAELVAELERKVEGRDAAAHGLPDTAEAISA